VETEKNYKYLIDPNSVEKRIKQLQQALHFSNKTSPDMSSYVETANEANPDMSRHGEQARETETPNKEVEFLRQRVEDLENEAIHLMISKAANETVINQLHAERKEYQAQMNDMSFRLGQATAKLELLEAPRGESHTRHVETEPDERVSEAIEVPSEPTPPAQPEPTPAATVAEQRSEKPSFFGRMFGR
jgi:hypothetical protein